MEHMKQILNRNESNYKTMLVKVIGQVNELKAFKRDVVKYFKEEGGGS